jgi:hypothetical protein
MLLDAAGLRSKRWIAASKLPSREVHPPSPDLRSAGLTQTSAVKRRSCLPVVTR